MLPQGYTRLITTLLMSIFMVTIMTFVITLINTGLDAGFPARWGKAFVIAWPIAFSLIFIQPRWVQPLASRICCRYQEVNAMNHHTRKYLIANNYRLFNYD